jgi:PAS domain S-box-containing protein
MTPNHRTDFSETVLRCVADGVFTVDTELRVTSFNRAAERITGVPVAKAIGRKCSDVFHSNLCETGCAIRRSIAEGCEVIDQPARILNVKGRAIPVSISTALLRETDGTVLGAVQSFRDLSALEQLRREIQSRYTFEDIIGKSEAFQKIFAILPDVAESDSTVLIEGPSGSGKELLARAIHNLSHRRKEPYVVVNCGTLPPTLFESELFGYKPGAFTDAKSDKRGRIAMAEGGTIFFDEIGDLPLETQGKLLRVLQEREYEPLGGVTTMRANVRVVVATNEKLTELVSRGAFRDDLYFRLAVVRLTIPPLRERRSDIPFLIEHFIERYNARRNKHIEGVTPEVMEILMRHDFPGNVRELENVIEYGFVLCHNTFINICHLPEDLRSASAARAAGCEELRGSPLRRAEVDAIRETLQKAHGHVGEAAAALGISRTTLWRKMQKYGVTAPHRRLKPSAWAGD